MGSRKCAAHTHTHTKARFQFKQKKRQCIKCGQIAHRKKYYIYCKKRLQKIIKSRKKCEYKAWLLQTRIEANGLHWRLTKKPWWEWCEWTNVQTNETNKKKNRMPWRDVGRRSLRNWCKLSVFTSLYFVRVCCAYIFSFQKRNYISLNLMGAFVSVHCTCIFTLDEITQMPWSEQHSTIGWRQRILTENIKKKQSLYDFKHSRC